MYLISEKFKNKFSVEILKEKIPIPPTNIIIKKSKIKTMPSWKIHLKWNRLLGIPDYISNEINELIDFPDSWFRKKYDINDEIQIQVNIFDIDEIDPCLSFYYLSKISGRFGHDMGRKRKWQRDFQLRCVYEHYGIQGIKATLLHHILDYIEKNNVFRCQ